MKNLARLLEQATPLRLDGPYYGSAMDMDANASLIAAAPRMADLLIACEKEMRKDGHLPETRVECPFCRLLARLADFDRRIG